MRIKKLHTILLLLAALLAVSCTTEPDTGHGSVQAEVKLRMLVKAPDAGRPRVRAVAESQIDEIIVMVFESNGTDYIYSYLVEGYSLAPAPGSAAYDYEFLARLLPSTVDTRLWIIANAGSSLGGITAGMTELEVKEAATLQYTSAGFTDLLPMTGTLDLAGGITSDATVNAVLVRSAAKVEVVNNADNFTLTSVKVYRATDSVQVIPDDLTGNSVTVPSIPAGAGRDVETETFAVSGNQLLNRVYISESAVPAAGDARLTATCVVVGGQFDGSTATTYYRMDFTPNDSSGDPVTELTGQVLRNHRYYFTIGEVLAAGWPSDDEASVNPSTGIDVEIKVWDDETLYMVFNDYDHLGVSRRAVRLSYAAGSAETVEVDTSLDTYRAYWSDQDGNIIDQDIFITPGGNFTDPDGLYNASISADGEEIVFTSLLPYDPATAQTKYLVIAAARMRVIITVTQAPASYANRAISIFNSTQDIGSLGNYVSGTGWQPLPGERGYGLANLLMGSPAYGPQNFGPGRTVDMDGIYLTGLNLANTMPRNYYQGSDVLYLTYGLSPTAAQAAEILQWLGEDNNRVLIVQFDNTVPANTGGTNYTMMAALGLSRIPGGSVAPYEYAGAAVPDFIRYGPFGTLPDGWVYKCRDDTYGSIDPTAAQAAGFLPILLSGAASTNPGNYLLSVNPQRRIILSGDCDLYSNVNAGSAGYFLDLAATGGIPVLTVDPANPAEVLMGNLWSWIVDVVLSQD